MKNNSKQSSSNEANAKNQQNISNADQKQQQKKLSESNSNKLLVGQTGQPKTPSKKSRRQSNDKSLLKTPKNNNQVEEEIPKYEQLSTGLRIFITDKLVHQMWHHDKPKQVLIEFLTNFVRYQGINKNFESIEINIIAEFHVFCLIFAKQELQLDDYKTAVFLNLMWTLLINNNNDYGDIYKQYSLTYIQSNKQIETLTVPITTSFFPSVQQNQQQQQVKQPQQNPQQPIQISMSKGFSMQISNKTLQDDFQNFKIWIQRHSHNEPPKSIKIFNDHEVCKILKYAKDSYFTNFQLYNYCLSDKKKNEEIRLHVYIDIPLDVPPLSEALYMGKPKLQIEEDEYDDIEHKNQLQMQDSINTMDDGSPQKQYEADQIVETQKSSEFKQEDPVSNEVKKIVEDKIKTFSSSFQQNMAARDQEIENQMQEFLNPKKKK